MKNTRAVLVAPLVVLTASLTIQCIIAAPTLELKKGDHICLIGNTLAERLQYFGHWETLLHARFPQHELVVRNLAFSADEIVFRPRSENFGSPDHHLAMSQADVVLAFFGFNESFKGKNGLPQFEQELTEFITHTKGQKYNGQSAPRLVLISPIAHENLKNPNLPDGSATNPNLQLYTQAMANIAAENEVPFVDLFTLTLRAMKDTNQPLTFNGIHLTDYGYSQLAPILDEGLFGKATGRDLATEKLRAEVNEKNLVWFHRYRAVNGYYIYGGRSERPNGNPPYTDAYVLENERGKLDDMAAIRDQRIWNVARGEGVPEKIDDSKTRPLLEVPTNFTEPIEILPPEEAKKKFVIAAGYEVNCFASEVEFPDLQNPVQLTFDARGRCWVATMPDYPMFQPPNKPNDRILIFDDTDGDGRADKQTIFADGLQLPTGFELGDGGVYVAQQPNVMFLKDTDGDDKADERKLILHGFDSGDSHHSIGAFTWGPGGGIYLHEGTFHHTAVETPEGPVRNAHGGVYRFDPRKQKLETFIHYNFANPWGHIFDKWGQNFVADASGGANYYGTAFSTKAPQFTGQDDFGPFNFAYQEEMKQFIVKRVRPTAGCEIVSSRHFPKEAQGNFLLNNCIGFQGVLQHTIKEEGSGFVGTEIEPILYSSDRNFRPTALQFGPDGALYIVDWYNPLVGHMQHNLRDPNRDHTHGRIWRVTYPSLPLVKAPQIAGQPIPDLLDLLKTYEDRTRYRVRLELRERDTKEVVAELEKWIAGLDKNDRLVEHHLLEALWVCQHHNTVNETLLRRVLSSPDYRARAATTRVLGYWRNDVADAVKLVRVSANDQHPRVRLEAVRACSFFENPLAAEAALDLLKYEMDYYLSYTLKHTLRRLEAFWKPVVASGQPFAADNPQALDYILAGTSTADLVNMVRSKPVYVALLSRHGLVHEYRHEALMGLAKLNGTDVMTELLATIDRLDKSDDEHAGHVLTDLAHIFTQQPASDFAKYRGQIEKLAQSARRAITRQIAYVTLISANKSADAVWARASQKIETLRDLLDSVVLIEDAGLRASMYDKVEPLMHGLPASLAKQELKGEENPASVIRRAAINAVTYIPGHDVETSRTLAGFVQNGQARTPSIRALGRLPRNSFPRKEIRPLVDSLVKYIESVPVDERTSTAALDALQLGNDLAMLLPSAQAKELRSKLGDLGVQVIVIRPVPHKMQYDRKDIFVEVGKPVEIVFENIDIMPHNLLVTQPGAMAEVGNLAERMATSSDAFAKHFIPDSPKVLHATRMLGPGDSQRLQIVAPKELGEFPFVCTFPGHWRTMFGTMHVVQDLDDIPLELLEPSTEPQGPIRKFVKQWTVDDLAGMLHDADHGRSFENGQMLFKAVQCVVCHRINNQGGIIGPDLAGVSKKFAEGKMNRLALLTEMIEPSKVMDKKYRTQVIETVDGVLISGVVVHEDEKILRIVTSPNQKPTEVPQDKVADRIESKLSLMPVGLLNTLTEKDILDLLAFIESAGDPAHEAFRK